MYKRGVFSLKVRNVRVGTLKYFSTIYLFLFFYKQMTTYNFVNTSKCAYLHHIKLNNKCENSVLRAYCFITNCLYTFNLVE